METRLSEETLINSHASSKTISPLAVAVRLVRTRTASRLSQDEVRLDRSDPSPRDDHREASVAADGLEFKEGDSFPVSVSAQAR